MTNSQFLRGPKNIAKMAEITKWRGESSVSFVFVRWREVLFSRHGRRSYFFSSASLSPWRTTVDFNKFQYKVLLDDECFTQHSSQARMYLQFETTSRRGNRPSPSGKFDVLRPPYRLWEIWHLWLVPGGQEWGNVLKWNALIFLLFNVTYLINCCEIILINFKMPWYCEFGQKIIFLMKLITFFTLITIIPHAIKFWIYLAKNPVI